MKIKKFFILSIFAIVLISGIVDYRNINNKEDKISQLQSANIEALGGGETIVELCDRYCYFKPGYVCVLRTNLGFSINCDDSGAKYSL